MDSFNFSVVLNPLGNIPKGSGQGPPPPAHPRGDDPAMVDRGLCLELESPFHMIKSVYYCGFFPIT